MTTSDYAIVMLREEVARQTARAYKAEALVQEIQDTVLNILAQESWSLCDIVQRAILNLQHVSKSGLPCSSREFIEHPTAKG